MESTINPCYRLTEEEKIKAQAYFGLAVYIGKRMVQKSHNASSYDMISFSLPTIVSAIRCWREDGGTKESTYVAIAISRNYKKHYVHSHFFPRSYTKACLDPYLFGERGVVGKWEKEDTEAPDDLLAKIGTAFRELKPRYQQFISLFLGLEGEPQTVYQIAADHGVSPQRISQIVNLGLVQIAQKCNLPLDRIKNAPRNQQIRK